MKHDAVWSFKKRKLYLVSCGTWCTYPGTSPGVSSNPITITWYILSSNTSLLDADAHYKYQNESDPYISVLNNIVISRCKVCKVCIQEDSYRNQPTIFPPTRRHLCFCTSHSHPEWHQNLWNDVAQGRRNEKSHDRRPHVSRCKE